LDPFYKRINSVQRITNDLISPAHWPWNLVCYACFAIISNLKMIICNANLVGGKTESREYEMCAICMRNAAIIPDLKGRREEGQKS